MFDWCQLEHSIIFENGTMSLAIQNQHSFLEFPDFAISGQISSKIDIGDINIGIPEENDEIAPDPENQDEGNIDESLLEESDLKLISKRSKWFESSL